MRFSTIAAILALAAAPALSAPAYGRRSTTAVQPTAEDVSGAIALTALAHVLSNSGAKQARTTTQTIEKVATNVGNVGSIVSGVTGIVDAIHNTYESL